MKGIIYHQLNVPGQLSIAGFNSIEHLEIMQFHPTVAAFDPYKIGHAAGMAVLERIQDNSLENREYIFAPEIRPGNAIRSL